MFYSPRVKLLNIIVFLTVQVTEEDVKIFFQQLCGKVSRLRLLGDYVHSTCIAFVEFAQVSRARFLSAIIL
jgi:hypothetical protein